MRSTFLPTVLCSMHEWGGGGKSGPVKTRLTRPTATALHGS